METRVPVIEFTSAERVPIDIIHRQAAAFEAAPPAPEWLDSILNCVFILNGQRQIVFASREARELVPAALQGQYLGSRLGEVMGCIHAQEGPGGCGTSKSCAACGALQAILSSMLGKRSLREFQLTRFIGCRKEAHGFLVIAAPLHHANETFSLLALADKANLKLRSAIRRLVNDPAYAPLQIKPTLKRRKARIRSRH
jgi:hypothetical protein